MKKLTLLLLSFLLCISSYKAIAQSVTEQDASTVAKNFLVYHSAAFTVGEMVAITENARHLGWVVPLSPNGFILVSSSYDLRPILAYSFESSWETGGNEQEIFQTLMRFDLANRLDFAAESGKGKAKIQQEWRKFLTGNIAKTRFEQWPPAGTTPTGGWLFANWTQNAPYNGMCPIDPNTNSRSVNGCPATAMAMILNCLEDIKGTRLSDADDYYHNFGAGNKYWIDNDWQAHGFPYFDSLNLYLDTLESSYLWSKPLSNGQKAALNFACGVALKQVYSSSVSGTWGIEQAAAAWQRFGFAESRLVYDSDTTLNSDLAENIKQGWPAHLGLVDPPVSVGHNVVVDGYNTDEFYHFNFGWGGSANGWYTMPPASAPYNLTVIEGIVLDIMGKNPHVGIHQQNGTDNALNAVYLPVQNQIRFDIENAQNSELSIGLYSVTGQYLGGHSLITNQNQQQYFVSVPPINTNLLIVHLTDHHSFARTFKLLIQN